MSTDTTRDSTKGVQAPGPSPHGHPRREYPHGFKPGAVVLRLARRRGSGRVPTSSLSALRDEGRIDQRGRE